MQPDSYQFPSPALSPDEVVRIQFEALKNNDPEDAGIEVTFRFASPANRKQTGPLERFAVMIKGPHYRPMLNFLGVEYFPAEVVGGRSRVRVKLLGRGGEVIVYAFYLSLQEETPYENCWMTDAVAIESWENKSVGI